jgi:hypothetical protein
VTGTDFGNRNVTIRIPYRQGEQHLSLDVPITLIGKTLDVPYVIQSPRELAVRQYTPGEGRREFEIQTCEARGAPPWLTGLKADRSEIHARIIEQVVVEPLGMDNELRSYHCEVTGPLPEVGGESVHFSLECVVANAEAQSVPPIRCRWEYARPLQCYPQHLLIDCRKEEPETRVTLTWNDPDTEPDWENIIFDGVPSGMTVEWSENESSRHRACRLRHHGTITEGFTLSVRSGTDGAALATIPVSLATR